MEPIVDQYAVLSEYPTNLAFYFLKQIKEAYHKANSADLACTFNNSHLVSLGLTKRRA